MPRHPARLLTLALIATLLLIPGEWVPAEWMLLTGRGLVSAAPLVGGPRPQCSGPLHPPLLLLASPSRYHPRQVVPEDLPPASGRPLGSHRSGVLVGALVYGSLTTGCRQVRFEAKAVQATWAGMPTQVDQKFSSPALDEEASPGPGTCVAQVGSTQIEEKVAGGSQARGRPPPALPRRRSSPPRLPTEPLRRPHRLRHREPFPRRRSAPLRSVELLPPLRLEPSCRHSDGGGSGVWWRARLASSIWIASKPTLNLPLAVVLTVTQA